MIALAHLVETTVHELAVADDRELARSLEQLEAREVAPPLGTGSLPRSLVLAEQSRRRRLAADRLAAEAAARDAERALVELENRYAPDPDVVELEAVRNAGGVVR